MHNHCLSDKKLLLSIWFQRTTTSHRISSVDSRFMAMTELDGEVRAALLYTRGCFTMNVTSGTSPGSCPRYPQLLGRKVLLTVSPDKPCYPLPARPEAASIGLVQSKF